MSDRIARLRARAEELEVAAILITSAVDVRYLTAFASSNAALLVDAERAYLVTDGRYAEAARSVSGVELVQAERDLAADLGERLPRLTAGPVAFQADAVTVAAHSALARAPVELVPARRVVVPLRAVKEAEEVEAIRRAAALADEAFRRLATGTLVGRTEAEAAWLVEREIRELGAEAVSFPPIVASGPNAALPHHHPGPREIGRGETVVVDAGAVVDGYCSDCTRTFATGPLPPALEDAYRACLEAQQRSLEALAVGRRCAEVDGVARSALAEHGYEVLHNLGHSVGLEIHEEPRLSRTSEDEVAAGNVLTVEPGVYLPGLGGVRIEDLVAVREDGVDVLTPFTKELVTVG